MQKSIRSYASFSISRKADEKFKEMMEKICVVANYQKFVIAFISMNYFLLMLNYMTGSFVFMNPIFQCNGLSETQQQACQHINECIITNDFTAVYKNKLYCDKEPLRTTIQTMFALGYMIGKISYPIISDIIGRRILLLIIYAFGICGMSTLLITIQYNIEYGMVIGELMCGLFGSGCSTISFIYLCDICDRQSRQICLTYCWSTWGLAEIMMYFFYNYLPEWNKFTIVALLSPICLVFICLLYVLIESPVYALFVKNDMKMFVKILKQLQFFNKIPQQKYKQIKKDAQQILQQLSKQKKTKIHLQKALTKIFCSLSVMKTVICVVLLTMGYIIFYFGMQGSMESQGFNYGVNMLFVGIVQLIALFSGGFVTRLVTRRFGAIFCTVFSSLVGIMFVFQFVSQNQLVQTIFIALARFTSCYISSFTGLFTSQLFQNEIRTTISSTIQGFSQIARLVLPYLIQLFYNLKIPPIIVFSIAFIVLGAVPVLFLKQTKINDVKISNNDDQITYDSNRLLDEEKQ